MNAPEFGFVHGDFTIMNLRATRDRVTAFDFDASCRHWRAYDLASFLHYFGARSQRDRKIACDQFLGGYSALRSLTSDVVDQIPLFGKMRLLYSFLVFAKDWGFEGLSPERRAHYDLRRNLFASHPRGRVVMQPSKALQLTWHGTFQAIRGAFGIGLK